MSVNTIVVNLVYHGPRYVIVEYPEELAYEILDKNSQTIGFITGCVAAKFGEALQATLILKNQQSEQSEKLVEKLVGPYCFFLNLPAVIH